MLFKNLRNALLLLQGYEYELHFHLNCNPLPKDVFYLKNITKKHLSLCTKNCFVTSSSISGKINAVNFGLNISRVKGYDYFLNIDADIIYNSGAIKNIIDLSSRIDDSIICSSKCPFTHNLSTNFQILYSFAVQCSFTYKIYPPRPTGSFYLIKSESLAMLPEGCNDGDYFELIGYYMSDIIVYSEYPKTYEEEVRRRIRLFQATQQIKHERFHDNNEIMKFEYRKKAPKQILENDTYIKSLNLFLDLHHQAQIIANELSTETFGRN